MTTYTAAPDAERIAERIIEEHHPHLEDARIEYVFRDKASTSHGRIVLGKARKIGGLNAFLARRAEDDETDDFFVVEIAEDEWNEMPPSKKRALIDHELCHLGVDEDDGKLFIKGHDVEEFDDIVKRHGLWKDDLAQFAKAAKEQMELGLGTDDAKVTISYDGVDGERHEVETSTSAIEDAAASIDEEPF